MFSWKQECSLQFSAGKEGRISPFLVGIGQGVLIPAAPFGNCSSRPVERICWLSVCNMRVPWLHIKALAWEVWWPLEKMFCDWGMPFVKQILVIILFFPRHFIPRHQLKSMHRIFFGKIKKLDGTALMELQNKFKFFLPQFIYLFLKFCTAVFLLY